MDNQTNIEQATKFCKHCGASLNVNSSPAPAKNISQPKDNKNTLIICATAIICVIIIAGAFVFLNSGNNEDVNVNTVESMSNDSVSEDASNDKNTEDSMTYAEATNYLSGASSTIIQNTFDEADANGDGLLTGSEISKFKKLADLTERTADTSNTENVEAQDYGAGDGTTKTRYCTTHGRVAVGSDNRCPYCEAEGLDSRTVKGSTEYI